MLERENIMVDMRDQASIVGIEKVKKELLSLSPRLIPPPMRLQIQIIIAVYYLGKYLFVCIFLLLFESYSIDCLKIIC